MRSGLLAAMCVPFLCLVIWPLSVASHDGHDDQPHAGPDCDLDFRVDDIRGQEIDLEDFEGQVVMIVNTASKCGLTKQYASLEKLYAKYQDQGFVIIGFPCNQFREQEPGSNDEILKFCTTKFDVSFPLMSKVDVNGNDAAAIYKRLTRKDLQPAGSGDITWNFEKFIIARSGQAVARFSPRTHPMNADLVSLIESELAK